MRIDSCRICGNELQVIHVCADCNEPKGLECKHCRKSVDDHIHLHIENISGRYEIPA